MSEIRVKDNESLDSALRRFKRSCARSGVLAEVRKQAGLYGPLFLHQKRAGEKAARRLPCPPDMHVRTEHN